MGGKSNNSAADAANANVERQYQEARAEKISQRDEAFRKSIATLRASQGESWEPTIPEAKPK